MTSYCRSKNRPLVPLPFRYCILLIAMITVVVSGCIRVEQQIEIDDDDTGKFTIRIALPIDYHHSFFGDRASGQSDPLIQFFNPRRGMDYFPESDGFHIRQYRVFEDNDMVHILVDGQIHDLNAAMESGKLGAFSIEKNDQIGRVLRFRVPDRLTDVVASPHAAAETPMNARMSQLSELIDGMSLSLKIRVPGKITDSSALDVSERTARWSFDSKAISSFLMAATDNFIRYE